jgi:hypothetical protein
MVNVITSLPRVEIGRIWKTRIECSQFGKMGPPVALIYGGAYIKSLKITI